MRRKAYQLRGCFRTVIPCTCLTCVRGTQGGDHGKGTTPRRALAGDRAAAAAAAAALAQGRAGARGRARRAGGGRPPVDDRDALRGVLFVLKTGIPWQALPTETFEVSGSSCWRRFEEWT